MPNSSLWCLIPRPKTSCASATRCSMVHYTSAHDGPLYTDPWTLNQTPEQAPPELQVPKPLQPMAEQLQRKPGRKLQRLPGPLGLELLGQLLAAAGVQAPLGYAGPAPAAPPASLHQPKSQLWPGIGLLHQPKSQLWPGIWLFRLRAALGAGAGLFWLEVKAGAICSGTRWSAPASLHQLRNELWAGGGLDSETPGAQVCCSTSAPAGG